MNLTKRIRKMDQWDFWFVKLNSVAAILFIITIWPWAMNLVHSINPWIFLLAFILLAARPCYKFYIKK